MRYYSVMIRSFGDRETERVFQRQPRTKFDKALARAVLRKLLMLDAVESLADLRVPPGNRLEKLGGNRAGQHSIRVNNQLRICFRWQGADAYDVEVVDYH